MKKTTRTRAFAKSLISLAARPFGTLTHVATKEPLVALTFDDGPHPESTPRMVETLEKHGARGTFFMVGKAAKRHPEVVERVARGGHAIGNHTWDHPSVPLLRGPARRAQIRWCADALAPHATKLFRPPYGHQSLGSHIDALRCGHRPVTWDVVAEDWAGNDADTLLGQVRERIDRGSIIIFHDALYSTDKEEHRDRGPTIEAVDRLLAEYGDRYRFVTVPELLESGSPRHWPWYWKSDLEWLRQLI